jgi:hypothetical protein
MQPHSFSKRQLAAISLMLDEEEKNVALSDKKKRMWVHKCFRSRKSEGSYGRNSDGRIFAHSKLGKYLETHLGIPEVKQLPGTSCLAPHVTVGDEAFPLKTYLMRPYPGSQGDRGVTVVKVLCYKSEDRWFDPSWCHWNFLLT